MKSLVTVVLLGLVGLAASPAVASAASIEDVTFAESHRYESLALPLRGVGLLRYRVVFKGYVAGLYLEPEVASQRVLEDVPKRLEIEYFWAIGASDFAKAQDDRITRNTDEEALEGIRPQMEEMGALYRDVEPGDRYALTYVPGRGTELALNGQPLGVVPGDDFARAIFSIWLGEEPLSRSLKQGLLGTQ